MDKYATWEERISCKAKKGTIYSKKEIRGYYNDLTERVSRFGRDDNRVPATIVDNGEEVYFSIAIFQYGLGAYDLYLKSGDNNMLEKAISCADWAVENQQKDGNWCTFVFENPKYPYSSMAQGEGISLLLISSIGVNMMMVSVYVVLFIISYILRNRKLCTI